MPVVIGILQELVELLPPVRPNEKYIIDVSIPAKRFQWVIFDDFIFQIPHEQVCVIGCHACAHSSSNLLQEKPVRKPEDVVMEDEVDEFDDDIYYHTGLPTCFQLSSAS